MYNSLFKRNRPKAVRFDPRWSPSFVEGQLRMGIAVEMEHTDDPDTAKIIALDHLAEMPDYYTRLAKMERGGR